MTDQRVSDSVKRIFQQIESDRLDAETRAAKANPKAYRNSLVFEGDTSYTYYTDRRRKALTRYCVSVHRNVAGYFVYWRERRTRKATARRPGQWRRDQFDSAKDRRSLLADARFAAGIK